ncbi:MAG: hypothetical protein KZQ57_07545 [gamma proteobacterium symbiont of Lucinoma myriamae]|nr:hypothetical protein [gamma proteobacterium symbiont of Lucinoma myriamae]
MKKKKQRIPIISPHFGEHVEIGGLDSKNGIFTFKDSSGNKVVPSSVTIGSSYTKESGKPKILNQINTNNEQINLNPNINFKNFDWLFVIDTNTKKYSESKISISCSAFFQIKLEEPKFKIGLATQDWHTIVSMQSAFIFRNPTVNPELIGWQELINRIKQSPEFNETLKVGIIVDSELDNLSKINRYEIPIIGNHFLPNNFQLIYASSDAGAEYPHNKLIRICDNTGNKIWDYLLQREEYIKNMENLNNLFIDGSATLSSEIVHKLSGNAT